MSETTDSNRPKPTRLVLIRHGEAQSHVDQIIGGHQGCTGLSDLGRRQATALRDRLERTGELAGADHLYASILPRAIETAEIIAPALGIDPVKVQQDCDLCEAHPGDADGIPWEQWRELYRPDMESHNEFEPWAPGAESWAEFSARVGRALHRLARNHRGETVVVACHGGVIESSLLTLARLPLARDWRVQIDNTSVTEWQLRTYDDFHRGERWTLARFNDAAHLGDLA